MQRTFYVTYSVQVPVEVEGGSEYKNTMIGASYIDTDVIEDLNTKEAIDDIRGILSQNEPLWKNIIILGILEIKK